MGSVRKTVGGTVLGTGIKYGGKMAMDAVMNVGTSALTTAIKSATLGWLEEEEQTELGIFFLYFARFS